MIKDKNYITCPSCNAVFLKNYELAHLKSARHKKTKQTIKINRGSVFVTFD